MNTTMLIAIVFSAEPAGMLNDLAIEAQKSGQISHQNVVPTTEPRADEILGFFSEGREFLRSHTGAAPRHVLVSVDGAIEIEASASGQNSVRIGQDARASARQATIGAPLPPR